MSRIGQPTERPQIEVMPAEDPVPSPAPSPRRTPLPEPVPAHRPLVPA